MNCTRRSDSTELMGSFDTKLWLRLRMTARVRGGYDVYVRIYGGSASNEGMFRVRRAASLNMTYLLALASI